MGKVLLFLLIFFGFFIWIISKIADYLSNRNQQLQKQLSIVNKFGNRHLDKSRSLEERNEDIIQNHLTKISACYHSSYYIENSVRDCINDIANAEGDFNMAPGFEYLSTWESKARGDYLHLRDILLQRFKDKYSFLQQQEDDIRKNLIENKFNKLLKTYDNLIQQFLEVTERKVSILDEYGDENWEELPKQISLVISKIAKREGIDDATIKSWHRDDFSMPEEMNLLSDKLQEGFRTYHAKQKSPSFDHHSMNKMSGVDFEIYLSRKLRELGYQTSGTTAIGDQGADIIAMKNGKKLIIQAKRYSGSVGNKAVQEVIGAVSFYQGGQGCVITNSFFTVSAKALAQKNNIILIDGHDLKSFEKYF